MEEIPKLFPVPLTAGNPGMWSDRRHTVGLHIPRMNGPTQVRNEYVGLTIVGPQIPTIGGHPGRMYM